MLELFFKWWGAIAALISILLAALALRTPVVRKNLGLKIRRSHSVDVVATDATKADIDVRRSQDVRIKIRGGQDDK